MGRTRRRWSVGEGQAEARKHSPPVARMHERNGDAPYRNTEDAIRCWPETARKVISPHGTDDLVGMIVRPSPAFLNKLPIY
jgi:hypothetical protein